MTGDPSSTMPDRERAAELGRRLALVTSTAGIGYWALERGADRAVWSAELRRMYGLADADPVPRFDEWLREHVHPDDRDRVRRAMRGWPEHGSDALRLALRIVSRDGTVHEVISHSMLEGDNDDRLLFGVLIDLTSLRQTERALRQAESRAALAARAVGMGTWDHDLRSGRAIWDAQMWALRGLEPRAEAPGYEERMSLVHPDDREAVSRSSQAPGPWAHEFRVLLPDGQVRWIASRSSVITDDDGQPVRRIGVNWDVTTSRLAEAVLRERELALRENETRSRTLARMSHELRTPLNAILGFAQLLQADETGTDEAAHRRRTYTDQIRQAGDHLLELVDKVLELTRSRPASRPPAPASAGEPPLRTVLYIEDNAVNTMIVSELVERRGDLRFESATTGAEGVARAVELKPALILLDMQLPDIDGPEVFRRLRTDPRTAAIPCIALSANAMAADIDAARTAGMADYWTKPFDFAVFARSLDSIFGAAPQR